eukprot:8369060-Pyramimonas_sp.AAC.2
MPDFNGSGWKRSAQSFVGRTTIVAGKEQTAAAETATSESFCRRRFNSYRPGNPRTKGATRRATKTKSSYIQARKPITFPPTQNKVLLYTGSETHNIPSNSGRHRGRRMRISPTRDATEGAAAEMLQADAVEVDATGGFARVSYPSPPTRNR